MLVASREVSASDLHLQPTDAGLDVRWRLDGVLQSIGTFPRGESTDPVTRLKVLAGLLTYRQDVPQEGRLQNDRFGDAMCGVEMRVSTFPTLRGERAVVRLFNNSDQPWFLDDLGLPADISDTWHHRIAETSGALIVCGPAGSGKTTTAYASIRQIVNDTDGGRSVVTIEDPIEVEVAGVAQSQVNANSDFTMVTGLRSLLRQDPEVIFVGEVRDPQAAGITFQAALTGQLALSTFHANSAAAAISRLSDMGIEPYVLRSCIRGILHQRLVRKLCEDCKQPIASESDMAGWKIETRDGIFASATGVGCQSCQGTGYRGRMLLAELLVPDDGSIRQDLISRSEVSEIEKFAVANGMVTVRERAVTAIRAGKTSPAEARRVLGFL